MSHVSEKYWRFSTPASIVSLAKRFGLPGDPFDPEMQDWEVQVADPSRLSEFLSVLTDATLTDDERFTLAELVVQCFEDAADAGTPRFDREEWHRFRTVLMARPKLHAYTACNWSGLETASEALGGSHVAGYMKPIWRAIENQIALGEAD